MAKNLAVDRLIGMLDAGLAKLPADEQKRVLSSGAQLLEIRRARLARPEGPSTRPAEKLEKIRAAR